MSHYSADTHKNALSHTKKKRVTPVYVINCAELIFVHTITLLNGTVGFSFTLQWSFISFIFVKIILKDNLKIISENSISNVTSKPATYP